MELAAELNGIESDEGNTAMTDGAAKLIYRHRKFGSRVLTVKARIVKDVVTDAGVVVQTVRDGAGALVADEVFNLNRVQEQGLPLPTRALTNGG